MKIKIVDKLGPEDVAMLQALYSRSAESVDVHLEKVEAADSGKFMDRYYVGYGHKSIADCGSTTIFIEGVSLLAAKAIQDWPLYSGQETSTRYIDMSTQPIFAPPGRDSNEARVILEDWMKFYTWNQEPVAEIVKNQYPIQPGEEYGAYQRAVKARAFDILRGFLPAGITTQLSWHTNLRQAGDHLAWLVHHPLLEVRQIAQAIRDALAERYPSSGAGMSLPQVSGVSGRDVDAQAEREQWLSQVGYEWAYNAHGMHGEPLDFESKISGLGAYQAFLKSRPRGCVLPHCLTDCGQARADFLLDFGSFRDAQRHRNGVVRMPLLDTRLGFHPWYFDQLGPLRDAAVALVDKQITRIARLDLSPFGKQYYTALGFVVPCHVTMSLPAIVYFMELRSSKTVHPTLRARVLELVERFEKVHPTVKLYIDRDPDDWTVRRGNQTIVAAPSPTA